MPLFAVIAAALALAAQPDGEQISVIGHPWAPFISPMGEPFRANSVGDDPFARWFQQADGNRDGLLTADEMRADAVHFFRRLDSDRNGVIEPEELTVYETEIAPEVQINTRWKRSRQEPAEARPKDKRRGWRADGEIDGYQPRGLQGAARYGLLNIPEPVAGADADFNRGTTLDEFQRAASYRFLLLDSKRAGRLSSAELEPLLPARPKGKTVTRFPDEEPHDTRVGQPFPKGN